MNLYRKVVIPVWDTNKYPNRHLPKMVLINQRLILRSLSYKFKFAELTPKSSKELFLLCTTLNDMRVKRYFATHIILFIDKKISCAFDRKFN